jgi:hypothetical protein
MTEPPDKASPALMYDYYLGGDLARQVDREAAERILELVPEIRDAASANRGFLGRAVRYLAGEHEVRQFIDIGAGMPAQRATHEVVEDVTADPKVLYTDVDPLTISRGQEILAQVANTEIIRADIGDPDLLFSHPATARLLDLTQPVALLIVSVIQFAPEPTDPWQLLARYIERLPSGSWLVLSAPTADHQASHKAERIREVYSRSTAPGRPFTRAEFTRFFMGLEIVPPYQGADPEITFVGQWGAEDAELADSDGSRWNYAAVARKP